MEGKRSRRRSEVGSRLDQIATVPVFARIILYYTVLYLLFHYLLHRYAQDVLERQLVGARDTLLLAAAIIVYVILCALPPFFWSRSGIRRPLSRGIESFICYAVVALLLNVLFRVVADGDTGRLSGLAVGPAWWKALSISALLLAFLVAAFLGARGARGKGGSRER